MAIFDTRTAACFLVVAGSGCAEPAFAADSQFVMLLEAQDELDRQLALKASQSQEGTPSADVSTESGAPWLVTLLIDGKAFCSGSLVSETWVLTAAHCLSDQFRTAPPNSGFEVALAGTEPDVRDHAKVVEVHRHSSWTGNPRRGGDLGLIRLDRAISADRASILTLAANDEFNRSAVVYARQGPQVTNGIEEALLALPSELYKFEVEFVTRSDCAVAAPEVQTIPVLCARPYEDGRDARHATHGSPLIIQTIEHRNLRQIGILSYGTSSVHTGGIVAYTDVRHYLTWLRTYLDDRR